MAKKWFIRVVLASVAGIGCVTARSARAEDPRREQVAAATARAVDSLRAEIALEPLGRNVTVQDLLDRTSGAETLVKTLQRAQQIGGVRWIDGQTCQVQLDISGQRVAQALKDIAATNPKKSPIAPELLAGRLRDWDNRTFSATGTSTGSAALAQVRPMEEGAAWSRVSDQARQQAVGAAKQNAIAEVIAAIGPVAMTGNRAVGDVLGNAEVRSALEKWIASRPVTQVEFRDDLQVRVTLATPGSELFDTFRSAVEKHQPDIAKAMKPDDWDRVRGAFVERVAAGARGAARAGTMTVTRASMNALRPAPSWVDQQIDAEGAGTPRGSRLKAARAAEADAQAKLRVKVDALSLAPQGPSVGDAAKQDPRLGDAVGRAISRARPIKVDYQPDGSAHVRVTLNLHDLWDEIAAIP